MYPAPMVFSLLLAAALGTDPAACADPVMAGVDGVSVPQNITKSNPVYPEEASSRRIAGKIILNAIICSDGHVEDVAILSGVPWGEGLLEAEAERTVKTWTYKPALKDGRPVAVYMTVAVDFNLEGRHGPGWVDAKLDLNFQNTTLKQALHSLEEAGLYVTYEGSNPPVRVNYPDGTVSQILRDLSKRYALKMELIGEDHDRLRVTGLPAHDDDGVTPPVLLSDAPLEVPPDAPQGEHGTVGLNLVVLPDGSVGAAAVTQSCGVDQLDWAAVRAAAKWTYRPAARDGAPIAVYLPASVTF